jgi:hypothetical protein
MDRIVDIINRTHSIHLGCTIASLGALVRIADRSSAGIREIFMNSGCVAILLQV